MSSDINLINSKELPLVSVFCPAYNAENFIEKTLLSILEQDYENFEIVVSDDFSTDKTVSIVKRLSDKYPGKIILNENPRNLGITDNCNMALSLCRGKYISLFAGDDMMYPGKIKAQVVAMESDQDCSLCYHSVDILDGDNNSEVLFTTDVDKHSYFSFFDIIARGGIIGACSLMIRSDALPGYGFSTKFSNVSDWLLHIEVALRGKIIKVDGIYAGYLRHKNGASRKTFETLDEIKKTLDYINARYNYMPYILRTTKKGYRRYILGELARLFMIGDIQRLTCVYENHLNNMMLLKLLNKILCVLIFIRFHNTLIVKLAFNKLLRFTK